MNVRTIHLAGATRSRLRKHQSPHESHEIETGAPLSIDTEKESAVPEKAIESTVPMTAPPPFEEYSAIRSHPSACHEKRRGEIPKRFGRSGRSGPMFTPGVFVHGSHSIPRTPAAAILSVTQAGSALFARSDAHADMPASRARRALVGIRLLGSVISHPEHVV